MGQSGGGDRGCSVQAARGNQDGRMARVMHAAGTMSAQAVVSARLSAHVLLQCTAFMQARAAGAFAHRRRAASSAGVGSCP